MKVFQCIHKYSPHIPLFEQSRQITDKTNITFEELRRLVIEDGYASSYILKPALDHMTDEVFFTIWDYERLQQLWAEENEIKTTDLTEIKIAQLKAFKPDVFYNMSPFCDDNFIELVKLNNIKCKTICWNGFVEKRPRTYPLYDCHLTLHKPFVDYWHKLGLKACELQPAIPKNWNYSNQKRPIDVLFYGQFLAGIFDNRNQLLENLLDYEKRTKFNIQVHLQYNLKKQVFFKILRYGISRNIFPPIKIRKYSRTPLYGETLYKTIYDSKIVVNAYGNNNQLYKSNMRVFEAIGHGAFLISERGNYPKGLEPDIDFYTYDGFEELIKKIEIVLNDWEKHQEIAQRTAEKMRKYFSKEKQWTRFLEIVKEID